MIGGIFSVTCYGCLFNLKSLSFHNNRDAANEEAIEKALQGVIKVNPGK